MHTHEMRSDVAVVTALAGIANANDPMPLSLGTSDWYDPPQRLQRVERLTRRFTHVYRVAY